MSLASVRAVISIFPILSLTGAVRRKQDRGGNRSKEVNLKQLLLATPNVDRVCPATRYTVPAA